VYSHNLPSGKGLIVRLHRVELGTDYPDQLNADNVNYLVTIAPMYAEKVRQRLPRLAARVVHIPQPIDCQSLKAKKLVGSGFRLGMLGWCPRLKRPDQALEIFELLWRRDRRYQLFFKGRFPTELRWVWQREDERAYYQEFMARLNRAPWRDAVCFEPFGDDVSTWFRKIGFILSVSDVEGCHVSVSEGMASGAVPVLLPWEGAELVYPPEYVAADVRGAAHLIERMRGEEDESGARAEALRQYACERFDLPRVVGEWERLLRAVAGQSRPAP
jgi:glycosyltransferase involved in cell wall biosynthesis